MNITVDPTLMVAFLFATTRCGAWLAFAPPFKGVVPAKVRAGLAVGLGLVLAQRLAATGKLPTTDTVALIVGSFYQVAIGIALALLASVLFSAAQSAGGMLDAFSSLTGAQLFDPTTKSNDGPMGRFYSTMATLVLLATNGHLILIAGLVRSFDAAPVSGLHLDRLGTLLTHDVGEFMIAALQIGAPILAALFITDVLLGLATRAAPKLNVLSLGFGAKSLVLLMLGGAALPLLPLVLHSLLGDMLKSMTVLVR
jgi:flagellar biosynthetic protein FliR